MAHYQKESHTVYDIEHHFVWVTKCRYHVDAHQFLYLCLVNTISRDKDFK